MQQEADKKFLQLAIEQAEKSAKAGGFPAGAVVVKDGEAISEGISLGYKNNDPTGHAETVAIRAACQKLQTPILEGATLYASVECCNMCFSVANWAGIERIVFACRKTPELVGNRYYEGSTSNTILNESNNRKMEFVFVPGCEEEVLEIIKKWENMEYAAS